MTDEKKAAEDAAAVLDNPEWTAETAARSTSFDEAFPALAKRARGPQKAPIKRLVSLRLDPRVIEHFRATGEGWQSRINEALLKIAGIG